MKTWIYRSSRKEGLYLYLPERDDFSGVAPAIMKEMGRAELALELELTPERQLAREDAQVVRRNLKAIGYHVQLPPNEENWASWDNVKAGIKAGRDDEHA